MKPVRKFQFGMDFDAEAERLREEAERQHTEENVLQEEVLTPPTPSFSETELQQAQQEAFEKGVAHGRDEMRSSLENTSNMILDHIAIKLEGMFAEQEKQFRTAQELAIRTSVASIKKCWPQIAQNLGLEVLEQTIRQAMDYNPEEMRIVVRVHDTMLDPIVKRLDKIQQQQAFAGKVIVLSDDSVASGDCKVEWADGGLERLSRVLSQQLDKALERILAGLSQTSQNVDTERTSS